MAYSGQPGAILVTAMCLAVRHRLCPAAGARAAGAAVRRGPAAGWRDRPGGGAAAAGRRGQPLPGGGGAQPGHGQDAAVHPRGAPSAPGQVGTLATPAVELVQAAPVSSPAPCCLAHAQSLLAGRCRHWGAGHTARLQPMLGRSAAPLTPPMLQPGGDRGAQQAARRCGHGAQAASGPAPGGPHGADDGTGSAAPDGWHARLHAWRHARSVRHSRTPRAMSCMLPGSAE